ncbi:hypothetical protein GDO86_010237 [Hymenochirus boettgeri]|uniref:Uncharacterized protein n=1 Tax=Hymenochirus boettgeri TaxID=247094 RepID=A0A8T2JPL7_9PIPI|nr:hypothetical protein GDO86_010237 [Hymenochirus boettgeri]
MALSSPNVTADLRLRDPEQVPTKTPLVRPLGPREKGRSSHLPAGTASPHLASVTGGGTSGSCSHSSAQISPACSLYSNQLLHALIRPLRAERLPCPPPYRSCFSYCSPFFT